MYKGVQVYDMMGTANDASADQVKAVATEIFQQLTACSRKAASLGDEGKALERAIDAAREVAHRIR